MLITLINIIRYKSQKRDDLLRWAAMDMMFVGACVVVLTAMQYV